MLATIILDLYRMEEREAMADALDSLCIPPHAKVFAPQGVYCYWEYETGAVLYLGETDNMPFRFRQHNGLEPCAQEFCKWQYIKPSLEGGPLGFSVLLQSKMAKNGTVPKFKNSLMERDFGFSDGKAIAEFAEGMLLEEHRKRFGDLPPWNKIGGAVEARGAPTVARHSKVMSSIEAMIRREPERPTQHDMLSDLVGRTCSALVSRYTIREIPGDFRCEASEDTVHSVRMAMVGDNIGFETAVRKVERGLDPMIWKLLNAEGYFQRKPRILADM
jgi:hypothetical protein